MISPYRRLTDSRRCIVSAAWQGVLGLPELSLDVAGTAGIIEERLSQTKGLKFEHLSSSAKAVHCTCDLVMPKIAVSR